MEVTLLENIVCCPTCKEGLVKDENKMIFICENCNANYEFINDIPVFLEKTREHHTN